MMLFKLRKEVWLFLLVVGLAFWLGQGLSKSTPESRVRAANGPEYQAQSVQTPPLAGVMPEVVVRRQITREPAESSPLPPRELPFPELAELPVVVPPLPMGPQAGAFAMLRRILPKPGDQEASAPAVVDDVQDGEPQDGNGQVAEQSEDYSLRYDRLIRGIGDKPWGYFVGDPERKYDLGSRDGPYEGVIKFRWINPKSGNLVSEVEVAGEDVQGLQLAKTLENEIELADRRIAWGDVSSLRQQESFVLWLLQKARRQPWVYSKAEARAKSYRQADKDSEEAFDLQLRVLLAQGDLGAAQGLLTNLPAALQGSSFQHRETGRLLAQLHLDRAAEEDLRQAVAINQPRDPRNHQALAQFLLQRQRPQEALLPARAAVAIKSRLEDPALQHAMHECLVQACLAVGDVQGAQAAMPAPSMGSNGGGSAELHAELSQRSRYLQACIAYASGDAATAEAEFRQCYLSGKVDEALFGLAASQCVQGKYAEAQHNLQAVANQSPLLRHLALASMALISKPDKSMELLTKAEEVNPRDPYVLYLLGRQQRLIGDLEGGVASLKRALELRDDFQEAMAELALALAANHHATKEAEPLHHAIRYVDRLVSLDQQDRKATLFLELQGLLHFRALDMLAARQAFSKAATQGTFGQLGVAIVDYSQGQWLKARMALEEMIRNLPLDDAQRVFAENLIVLMEAHENLEQIEDAFDRQALGKRWTVQQNGSLLPRLQDQQMQIRGRLEQGGGNVLARREMEQAGRLQELSVKMQLGAENNCFFAGLAMSTQVRGAGANRGFSMEYGVDERRRFYVRILDGRSPAAEREKQLLGLQAELDRSYRLQVRLQSSAGDSTGRSLTAQLFLDGELVHERELMTLNRQSRQSLNTDLSVSGQQGRKADVSFDDYRRVQERGQ